MINIELFIVKDRTIERFSPLKKWETEFILQHAELDISSPKSCGCEITGNKLTSESLSSIWVNILLHDSEMKLSCLEFQL